MVKKLVDGQVAANDFVNTKPDEAQQAISDRDRQDHRQAAGPQADQAGVADPGVHQRPDRRPRSRPGSTTRSTVGLTRAGRPQRPLRPEATSTTVLKAHGEARGRAAMTSTHDARRRARPLGGRALRRDQGVRPRRAAPSLALDRSRWTSRRASSSAWSARPAAARARCSTWSPGSTAVSGGTIAVAGGARPGLMFQEPALFPWLTVGGNVELPLKLRGAAPGRAPGAGRGAAATPCTWATSPQAAARAVRRHAPAGRAGPHARPGHARPADGRAVRRARRDDPRHPARRARADLARAEADRPVRDAQRARGGPARRPDRAAVQPARPGHLRDPVDIPRPRRIDSPEVAAIAADVTDRLRAEVGRHGQ